MLARTAIHTLLFISLCLAASLSIAEEEAGWEVHHCQPRIKFLDDLFHGLRSATHRDPYEERIETERHDFTQSTKTVGHRVVQIEAGYSYFYKDQDDETEQTHATPEMLLRLGLSDDIEFRLRWNYTWRFIDEADNVDSAQDLGWSFKLAVTDQHCWMPETGTAGRRRSRFHTCERRRDV